MQTKTCLFSICLISFLVLVSPGFIGCLETHPAMPNPAAQKCIQDGYEVQPIIVNGVPQGSLCVDPATGKKCEVWQYYRGKCDLSNTAPATKKE